VAVAGLHHSSSLLALWKPLCLLSLTRHSLSSRNVARRHPDVQLFSAVAVDRRRTVAVFVAVTTDR
jgi:hypothetical protein